METKLGWQTPLCGLTKLLFSIITHFLSMSLNCRRIILRTFIVFFAATAHWVDTTKLSVTKIPKSHSSVVADRDSLYVELFCCMKEPVVMANMHNVAFIRIKTE